MYVLKRLLAIVLGVIVLPFRILAYNAFYEAIAFLLGVSSVISLPIYFASAFNNLGISIAKNVLMTTLIIFPLVATGVAITFAAASAFLVYHTIINILESFWLGFRSGLLHEMAGFWNALASQTTLIQDIDLHMRAFQAGVHADELIDDVDFDGFQRIREELQDVVVVKEDLDVPDLERKAPRGSHPLNDIELKKINTLIKNLTNSQDSLSLEEKKRLDALKTLYTQYNDLSKKLEDVRTALVENDKTRIKDEMIAFNEVETPILLVKQYKKEEQWHNVPASSYVTDKESLLHWLKQNPKHPLNKDTLKKPEYYKQMETQYIWYELTKDECTSQELAEIATQMSDLLQMLLPLVPKQKMNIGLCTASQSFFSSGGNNSESPTTQLDTALTGETLR
ncbi:coiled coil protein [Legionella resiliens]|uniref:Coiled coil protein n=1 Tax=Legionella resiliens TaxID=2905958 RepID=A0ABS8WYN9_9GAMM|nr:MULTISPECIES: coiled coil protein [unclassified Legionella]MCE0722434.1 coiled coil protein [Legionella sp. 9fVS26]MCE3531588.1 coiled coil protein [Legionella sp. 8cVS16]